MKSRRSSSDALKKFRILFLLCTFALPAVSCLAGASEGGKYLKAVQDFADTVIEKGRDTYGDKATPLFVDGLHAQSLKPVIWKKDDQSWVLSNFASQQPLIRILDGLSALTKDPEYRRAAVDATGYVLWNLQSGNGLLYWGGHLAWDLETERVVGQYAGIHEMKGHQPYYRFMWQVDRESTRKLMGAVWATHILDWSLLDYNRHANTEKPALPKWDHEFDEAIEVPFPIDGGNLSFANVTPPLMHSGTMLAALDKNRDALKWTRRLVYRWQQGKDPETGLCGGQLSYRKNDRAKDALGHVHPSINEAKIVASYHQTSRYHHIPLAQMQALTLDTENADWRAIYAMLELHRATGNRSMLRMACSIADNLLKLQTSTGLFPRAGREYARTGDEIPLALLHLAAALEGKSDKMPPAVFDSRFFHCEYHGQLAEHQQKRADKRTYDNYVFYGSP